MKIRTGVDLASISTMDEHLRSDDGRYASIFLTEAEQHDVGGSARRAAGRWAAKESAMKALGHGMDQLDPRDIEITTDHNGDPSLTLHGAAERRAADLGLVDWDVSLTYDGDLAMAMVVAVGRE